MLRVKAVTFEAMRRKTQATWYSRKLYNHLFSSFMYFLQGEY